MEVFKCQWEKDVVVLGRFAAAADTGVSAFGTVVFGLRLHQGDFLRVFCRLG